MKATRSLLAAMVLGTAIGASQANAQTSCGGIGTCNQTNTASVAVPALVKMTMSSLTTSLTSPSANDIDAGAVIANVGPTFTIKANRSWTLKIKSVNAVDWTYVGSNAGVKPISDLAWSTSAGGTYAAITNSDVTFASGASATNSGAAAAFFKTTWIADFASQANVEGTYSLPIMFTLSAP
ncbi:MAG: hypothetical protein M3Z18_06620 [Gemmatimonadota bacterium]|nr:hypothetical protein [Gemmatimonadota bacterium]